MTRERKRLPLSHLQPDTQTESDHAGKHGLGEQRHADCEHDDHAPADRDSGDPAQTQVAKRPREGNPQRQEQHRQYREARKGDFLVRAPHLTPMVQTRQREVRFVHVREEAQLAVVAGRIREAPIEIEQVARREIRIHHGECDRPRHGTDCCEA